METSAKAFLEHWNWAAAKGVMNRNTAAGMRSACTQVLSAQDDWENLDIKTLDVDNALVRFQNLKKKDFKPTVLETYKRRFRLAVTQYLEYLQDPGGWRPRQNDRAAAERSDPAERPRRDDAGGRRDHILSGLVDYPFPLRDGLDARLSLPRDLKVSEVRRLHAFMSTLAVDLDSVPSVG